FGLRTLQRSPEFTAVAVATLALAVGANSALFSVVNAVLLRGFGYDAPDRLVQITGVNKQGQTTGVSIPDFVSIQKRVHSFTSVAASRVTTFTLSGPREPENIYGQMVSPECLSTLAAPPLMERLFTPTDFESAAPPVVIISYTLWQTSFEADPRIVGRRALINGAQYTVVGVMRPEFQYPHPAFRMWAPWKIAPDLLSNHGVHGYTLLARLRPGATGEQAQAELKSLSQAIERESPQSNTGWRAVLEPINEQVVGRLRSVLWILTGAVGFVLLIACMNVGNLLLARGIRRSREFALRAALGATRARLARQLLTESLLIGGAGCALGLLLARWWLRALLATLPERAIPVLPRADRAAIDLRVLALTLAACAATAILFGLLPALQLSRPNIEESLKEGARSNSGGGRKRRLLGACIVLEAALSVVLLAGAGVMIRSFANLTAVRPGFRPEHVLTLQVPSPWSDYGRNSPDDLARKRDYFHRMVEHVQAVPNVGAAALVTVLPLSQVQVQTLIVIQGRPRPGPGEDLRVQYRAISPDYFRVMGIPILRGRAFTEDDRTGRPQVVIVSESLARRHWPNEDAVGKQLSLNPSGNPWMTVVGVCGSVRFNRLDDDPQPELYTAYQQTLLAPQVSTIVLRTAADPLSLIPAARAAIREVDPNQPVAEVKAMTQIVADSVAQPRFYTLLLAIFAALALVLAAAGIFSVVAWTVNQATQEIGIRMALGASPRHVLRAVMGRVLLESIGGAAAGLGGAAALTRLLKTQLYGVTSTDPVTFVAVPAVLTLVAALAGWLPARRATHVDPAAALRA
ncbi:MAG TPA: ABC transporter permease, partial [Bryobacteraceae bacterium]